MKEKHWMAIYTKPRSEKKVAERLARSGFEVYCPLQTTIKQWSDRKKKVQVPIFPSYIFVHVYDIDRPVILQDPAVLNFVYYVGKPAIIRDIEIEMLKQFLDNDYFYDDISIYQYKKGDKVDIIAGPFKDYKAKIDEIQKSHIILLVDSIGVVVKLKTKVSYISK
ncbi:MAG: UpxY family transcription antiterminator [Chitinophagales bacterium]